MAMHRFALYFAGDEHDGFCLPGGHLWIQLDEGGPARNDLTVELSVNDVPVPSREFRLEERSGRRLKVCWHRLAHMSACKITATIKPRPQLNRPHTRSQSTACVQTLRLPAWRARFRAETGTLLEIALDQTVAELKRRVALLAAPLSADRLVVFVRPSVHRIAVVRDWQDPALDDENLIHLCDDSAPLSRYQLCSQAVNSNYEPKYNGHANAYFHEFAESLLIYELAPAHDLLLPVLLAESRKRLCWLPFSAALPAEALRDMLLEKVDPLEGHSFELVLNGQVVTNSTAEPALQATWRSPPTAASQLLLHLTGLLLPLQVFTRTAEPLRCSILRGATASDVCAQLGLRALRGLWPRDDPDARLRDLPPDWPIDLTPEKCLFDPTGFLLGVLPDDRPAQLFVKGIDGMTATYEVDLRTSGAVFKRHICLRVGLPLEEPRLIFSGKQCEDWQTLEERGLRGEATLHLVLRLRCDRRFKCHIAQVDPDTCKLPYWLEWRWILAPMLERWPRLKLVSWHYRSDCGKPRRHGGSKPELFVGFVAQQVQTVAPELVATDAERRLWLSYGSVVDALAFSQTS